MKLILIIGVIFILLFGLIYSQMNLSKLDNSLTNDQIITEAKKCLDAGLDWDISINKTRVWCAHK